MKLIAIDVETTGLNPDTCQILEFGALIFDPRGQTQPGNVKYDSWSRVFKPQILQGEPTAFKMHARSGLLSEVNDIGKSVESGYGPYFLDFRDWLEERGVIGKYVFTGKNFARLDYRFLIKNGFDDVGLNYSHRFLDVGSLYFDPATDDELPSTNLCIERAKKRNPDLVFRPAHRTIDDCINVAILVQEHYKNR